MEIRICQLWCDRHKSNDSIHRSGLSDRHQPSEVWSHLRPLRLRVSENRRHLAPPVAAEVKQQPAIVVELIETFALIEFAPTVSVRKRRLSTRLRHHLQKQEIGELGHIFVIGNPIVSQYVAEAPKLCD